jgi:hypothetical protein
MVGSTKRHTACGLAAALVIAAGALTSATPNPGADRIPVRPGHVALEVVGQVNNLPATAGAPLGSSQQFGYVSFVEGLDDIFADAAPANQNETTAAITFFTEVNTTRVTAHGPFSIVIREGTTTFYRSSAPASFAAPDSFRAGEPIVVSTIRQQVILDTVEKTFTVVNMNTITATTPFVLGSGMVRIGARGDVLRTSLNGVLRARDGVPPPTGHFAGSVVGVARATRDMTDSRER